MEIAVYGKGGIGKSTISANLSAALASAGHHVLQIGCDPKHDSTRQLVHGRPVPTVLDYLRGVSIEQERPEAVLKEGIYGIGCIEAGGPKPGVGCAGRGIISAFEFLNRHHIKENYDTVIYDVLGDVVCGGFAVPVRREYADAVFLVTSGEYMSLYAANNILRGIRNFDGDRYCRVAGIIYNERLLAGEEERVLRFAKATGLPIAAKVPRSNAFAKAEEEKRTVMELSGFEAEKQVFKNLAAGISDTMRLYAACPLTDEELEEAILLVKRTESADADDLPSVTAGGLSAVSRKAQEDSESIPERPPLYGCAFNGAAVTAVHLQDAHIIAHGPDGCAFYTLQSITSPGRKNLFKKGILMPSALHPNFESSGMGAAEAVFGGMELLSEKVKAAVAEKPGAVIVISSCTSGIIGDDISAAEALSSEDVPVIALKLDGVLAGDYMEGIRQCRLTLAERLIDTEVKPEGRLVNIVGEVNISNATENNFRIIERYLSKMGIAVGCRFLNETSVSAVKNFLKAPLNILASPSQDNLEMKAFLEEKYGCVFADEPIPTGFDATARFLRSLGAFFGCGNEAEEIIREREESYMERIEALKPALSGKKLLLTTINANIDWLLSAAHAAGMRIVWLGVLNYLRTTLCVTDHPEYCDELVPDFTPDMVFAAIAEKKPDIVLTNYTTESDEGDYVREALPMAPEAGFDTALSVLERWKMRFENRNVKEGDWKNDRELFEKYFA